MKTWQILLLSGVVLLGSCTSYLVCAVVSKPIAVMDKITDPDNMIYNYEYFHSTYESVKSLDQKIKQAEEDSSAFEKQFLSRTEMTREDREESARLKVVLSGLKQQRANVAAEYNARAKMADRKIFKDHTLPDVIN